MGREQADKTRQLIVQSALALIAQEGISALTAGNLIQKAGISKGGLYHHFRHMDDVALAALVQLVDELLVDMDLSPAITTDQMLDTLEHNIYSLLVSQPGRFRALQSFMSVAMFQELYRREIYRIFSTIQHYLADNLRAFHGKQIAQEYLDAVVQMLSAFVYGLAFQGYVQPDQSTRGSWVSLRESVKVALQPQ